MSESLCLLPGEKQRATPKQEAATIPSHWASAASQGKPFTLETPQALGPWTRLRGTSVFTSISLCFFHSLPQPLLLPSPE